MMRLFSSIALIILCMQMNAKGATYSELPADETAHMNRQRAFGASICKHLRLPAPTRNRSDFELLQRIVDSGEIQKTEAWKLQSLGVIFGDALANANPKLRWMLVSDDWGTDPALLYGDTTLQLNPVTMISKRVEDGVTGEFVASLANTLLKHVEEEGANASKR